MGVAMLGTGITDSSYISIGCAAVVIGLAFKFGLSSQKTDDRLSALEKSLNQVLGDLKEIRRTRTMDIDTLRSDVLGCGPIAASQRKGHDTGFIRKETRKVAHILLIDDDPTFRVLFKSEMSGVFEIEEAAGLEEGFNKIERQSYDCVLLDLNLPDSFRDQTIAEFVARNPSALCVAISGSDDPLVEQKCIQNGANAYLNKHLWSPEYCRKIVEHAIQRKKFK